MITKRGRTIACKAATNPAQPILPAQKSLVARVQRRSIGDAFAYTTAVGLAGVAAVFSIRGMVVLFPGAPITIVAMAATMEAAKLVTAGWLAAQWSVTPRLWRGVLAILVGGLALINATGVFSQLAAAHVGERVASAAEIQDAVLAAKIEVAADKVTGLDRRLGQIDTAVEGAAKRGRTDTALSAMEGQRKARAMLASERTEAAGTLASLKAERASVAANGRQAEVEAAPIRYVAELVGSDSERAIRALILLMVLCGDPLAIALTAAASARRPCQSPSPLERHSGARTGAA